MTISTLISVMLGILYYCAIPALIQLVVCLFAKSGWVKSIPIILMSLFWVANFIMAFLFYTPLLREFATFHMSSGPIGLSDQAVIACVGFFAIVAQALVWLIVSQIQRILRKGK